MKKAGFIIVVLGLLSNYGAVASDVSIECTASGRSLSNRGEGLLNATASLTFREGIDAQGLLVLKNIEGTVRTTPENANDSYVGNFKIASLPENPQYRPLKYKGCIQFPNFDATDTTGSIEDRMWGQLLLQGDSDKPTFSAHYIFKAGDHMGGTLHMVCRVQN